MKKNKYYGMNVEFDNLVLDFGKISLNKKKESLCGDYYTIVENENHHVLVLSDGLGSGVKANILATLTAKMLSTMVARDVSLEDAVTTIARTLPICSVRHLAYATFTLLDVIGDHAYLAQFDNPDAIVIRDGNVWDYPMEKVQVEDKEIHKSNFCLQENDMLILMSDGVTNAGMGKTTDGGWGREDVVKFCAQKYKPGMSAQMMAGQLGAASVDLNLNETDDDITVVALRVRPKKTVNLMIGPPKHTRDDEVYLKTFFQNPGSHIICGGTTAHFAAHYLGKELKTVPDSAYDDIPARSSIDGVELVTEGYLTISRLLEYCEEALEDPLAYNKITKRKDGAAILGNMLFKEATEVNIFYGNASNPDNAALDMTPEKKEKMVESLIEHLKNAGIGVKIALWAV